MKRHFLLIPKLSIKNANALSSPFTIGFPAMTAWLGGIHALERKLNQSSFETIKLINLAISCHQFDLQTYKGKGDFVHSIIGTSNPLNSDGSRPAFIEEARCHLTVSLLIEISGYSMRQKEELLKQVQLFLMQMKMASGDILSFKNLEILSFDEDADEDIELKKLVKHLMLGTILVERRDLMEQSMNEGQDSLDALIEHLRVTHKPMVDENNSDNITWESSRLSNGWIVPISVGFQGISPLSCEPILNQRDNKTPHRFAESIITLGEFKMPYRIKTLDEMLWQYEVDLTQDLYLCRNQK